MNSVRFSGKIAIPRSYPTLNEAVQARQRHQVPQQPHYIVKKSRILAATTDDNSNFPSNHPSLPPPPTQAAPVSTPITSTPHPPIDTDLLHVLELASDDELEEVYDLLHAPSLFSPLLKSTVLSNAASSTRRRTPLPSLSRLQRITLIDRSFRFLAANASETIRGKLPSYREALLGIRDQLKIQCDPTLMTTDLEAEIFIHLVDQYSESGNGDDRLLSDAGDGISQGYHHHRGKRNSNGSSSGGNKYSSSKKNKKKKNSRALLDTLKAAIAPLKYGASDILPAAAKFGGTIAFTQVGLTTARELGREVVMKRLQYQAATRMAAKMGAQRGLTAAAARYTAMRTFLSAVGPIMWVSTALDIAVMSIGSDYGRVARVVFALAQVRLTRTGGWTEVKEDVGGGGDDGK
jgi:uncharacterized protein YaaW (UPF0174 family)